MFLRDEETGVKALVSNMVKYILIPSSANGSQSPTKISTTGCDPNIPPLRPLPQVLLSKGSINYEF